MDQSRFLEAPFVRMLHMRSASLKNLTSVGINFGFQDSSNVQKPEKNIVDTGRSQRSPMLAIEFHPETLQVVEEENNDIASMKSTEESKVFMICQVFLKLMLLACHKKSYLTKSYF